MLAKEKLKKYIEDNGLKKNWVAKQLGISEAYFRIILSNDRNIPLTLWRKIVELTKNTIKLEDFLEDIE